MKRKILWMLALVMLLSACQTEPAATTEQKKESKATAENVTTASAEAATTPAPEALESQSKETETTTAPTAPRPAVTSFECRDLEEQTLYLGQVFADHKLTVINFWASWCPPCVGELPELEKLYQKYADQGVAFVGVLIDGVEKAGLRDGKDLLKKAGVTYLNVIATPALQNMTSLMYIPTTIFVNEKGEQVGSPMVGADPAAYEAQIQELLK